MNSSPRRSSDPVYREIIEASRVQRTGSTVADGDRVGRARDRRDRSDIKAICCFTQSGTTALLGARTPAGADHRDDLAACTARRLCAELGHALRDVRCELERFKQAVVNAARAARAQGYADETTRSS
jgi:pyruvate kinase